MDDSQAGKGIFYQAPRIFVGLFYTVLTIWTIVSVPLIILKASGLSPLFLLMMAFVIVYTWYFSLGIFYTVRIEDDKTIQLKSVKRSLRTHCREINQVEGPSVPMGFGFMKFRLEREKVYVFFHNHRTFRQLLSAVRKSNPNIKFKNLTPKMFQIT